MHAFSRVRPDGVTVTLSGPRWRLELRNERNKLVEAPQDWLVEHASGAVSMDTVVSTRELCARVKHAEQAAVAALDPALAARLDAAIAAMRAS